MVRFFIGYVFLKLHKKVFVVLAHALGLYLCQILMGQQFLMGQQLLGRLTSSAGFCGDVCPSPLGQDAKIQQHFQSPSLEMVEKRRREVQQK